MKKYLFYFCLLLTLAAFVNFKSSHIAGVFYPGFAKYLYIYKLDYFSRSDDVLLIDSIRINSDKSFSNELVLEHPSLLYLTPKKEIPPTIRFFKEYPKNYYYSFCSKFYSNGVYIYIAPGDSIGVEWIANKWPKDSIKYGSTNGAAQQFLRTFYEKISKEDFDNGLRTADGKYKKIKPKEAFEVIRNAREKMEFFCQNKMPRNHTVDFEKYIATEIKLGSLNQFLNWYESVYSEDLNRAFKSKDLPKSYVDYYKAAISKDWNTNSIELYKFIEKYITYEINLEEGVYKTYYEKDDLKIKHALNLHSKKLKDLYFRKYEKQK